MQRSLGVSQLTIFSLLIIFPHKCKIDTTIPVLSSPVNLWRILNLCKILNKMSRGGDQRQQKMSCLAEVEIGTGGFGFPVGIMCSVTLLLQYAMQPLPDDLAMLTHIVQEIT